MNDKWIYEISRSVIRPDVAFFLDVPVDTAVSRVRSRSAEKDRYIDMELQYRLREEYLQICDANGGILIPTGISQDDSYAIIKEAIGKVMAR